MTPTEALARIAAICWPGRGALADEVRDVLAEVSPEPVGVLDRDQAREAMLRLGGPDVTTDSPFMNALAACVTPVAGATLTGRDAHYAAHAIRYYIANAVPGRPDPDGLAIAARLEATQ